jgi:hypothetical protein
MMGQRRQRAGEKTRDSGQMLGALHLDYLES